jgi:molybdopterin molybdotransferase
MLDVYRKPQVAIVATGDELVDVDQIPSGAQIVNSSAYALAAAIGEAGGAPTILKIARDTIEDTRERLSEAMRFDVVFSTGGVSVGQFDHVKGVMDELGMRTLFHGVAQRPGRPLKFGIMGGRPVFGLPGNPVSTMVCFYLYARPALRKMGGYRKLGLPRIHVTCAAEIKVANNLTEFVRVRLERRGAEILATPTGSQGSGILSSLSRADALLIGPANENVLKAGATATALLLDAHAATDEEAFFEAR